MMVLDKDLRATLLAGLAELQLDLGAEQIDKLLAYQAMIAKWTKVYNLTAVRDPAEMMTHHLLDSLAAVPALRRHLQAAGLQQGGRLLDVGSGAGLPGVVIAICCPMVTVTCVDTVAKKAAFIKQAALELKLPNLAGLHARVESITQPFDVICSRAFASLLDFTQWSQAALAPQGVWMAMKGKHPADELRVLPEKIGMFHVEQLQIPGLQAERCILWLRPVA
ncbi:MAG: rRNA m(7)G-527 methyltransferase [Polaromonas sp.]|nr:rRNA m(7)G-527 methyltransferase [Polaromonas sp.]